MPVTPAGYVRKLESECIAEILAECRARVDSEYDDSPDSVTGQILGIVGSKWAESFEVLEAVWGALNENASGAALDRIAAITNTFRLPNERDAALRIRRRAELADQGATTEGAIRSSVSKVPGVTGVRVVSNRSPGMDAAGRPPKSVEVIVFGSMSIPALATTIWNELPAGIQAFGTATTTITDSESNSQIIGYSIAGAQNAFLRIVVEVDEGSFAGAAVLKQRLIEFTRGEALELVDGRLVAGGVSIGGVVWRSRVAAAALTVSGVTAVRQVLMRRDGVGLELQDADMQLLPREYLGYNGVQGFTAERIEVVTT